MKSSRKPELSIIIPAYNEEKRICPTLKSYSEYFKRKNVSYEIIVMMDGCTDNTPNVVKDASEKNPNIIFEEHHEKLGKGGALLEGFKKASGKFTAYTDADGATPPEEIIILLKKIGKHDGIIGSRWMKGSVIVKKQPFIRRIASRGFNLMTRIILGLPYKDTQCPAKMFRSSIIKDIIDDIKVNDFAIDACMLYLMKKKGYNIKEIPIKWNDKPLSSLKIRNTIPSMFKAVIKTRLGV